MVAPLHIIASCTERKRVAVPAALRLREVVAEDTRARAREWWRHLKTGRHATVAASALYAGEHWSVVLGLPEAARASGFTPRLWVASAGYGLIPVNAAVQPYSATFARGNEDSVVTDPGARDAADQLQLWWGSLSEYEGPAVGQARTIMALAEDEPHASILVVASSHYVAALAGDLAQAARQLTKPERLFIVSTPSTLSKGELAPHWIPSSAHHQQRLGGSKLSLHARVARELLRETPSRHFDANAVRQRYERWIETSSPPPIHHRAPMSDDQVRSYIRRVVKAGAKSWSASLRLLRSEGQACEQSRFKRLFLEVQEGS